MDKLKEFYSNLSGRERLILLFVLVIAVGSAYFTLEYEPQKLNIKVAKLTEIQVDQSLSSYQAAISNLNPEKYRSQIESINREINLMENSMKNLKERMSGKPVEVIRALRREAQRNQARMESIKSNEQSAERGGVPYREITIQLRMVSKYRAISSFIQGLEAIPAVMSIKKLKIVRKHDLLPKVETDMTIQLFIFDHYANLIDFPNWTPAGPCAGDSLPVFRQCPGPGNPESLRLATGNPVSGGYG